MTDANGAGEAPVPDTDGSGTLDAGALGPVAWVTDVGKIRSRNEDRLFTRLAFGGKMLVLAVADGAGGHKSGDKAAEEVVKTLDERFPTSGELPSGPPADWIREIVATAHRAVRALGGGEQRPPASTVVGLVVEVDTLAGWRFHVGDSRIYAREPGGAVRQWTRDHNITNGLIDRGLPVAQALKIAEGGKLTQVIGGGADPTPDVHGPFAVPPGTSFLLCSDGIYGYNEDRDVLGPALDRDGGAVLARMEALKAAVLAGVASDNLTAVAWDVPVDAKPQRVRLGLLIAYDKAEMSTQIELEAMQRKLRDEQFGPTGPPPPDSMPGMRKVTDEDIEQRDPVSLPSLPSPPPPSSRLGLLLGLALAAVGVMVLVRGRGPDRLTDADIEAQRAAAEAAAAARADASTPFPEPGPALPFPADPRVRQPLDVLIAGLDPDFWQRQPHERKARIVDTLSRVLAIEASAPLIVRWEEGAEASIREKALPDWIAPGGANAERAADAWSARALLLADMPDLAAQAPVRPWLRRAGCRQVEARWLGARPDAEREAFQLAAWIAACLPHGEDTTVRLRLGGWPDVGWRRDEVDALRAIAAEPGDGSALLEAGSRGPRIQELGELVRALRAPSLHEVHADFRLLLPASDLPADPTAAVARVSADGQRLEALLREAIGDPARVSASCAAGEAIVEALPGLLPAQAARVDDLNRRVEVTLTVATPLEDDAPERTPEPELPGDPQPGATPTP